MRVQHAACRARREFRAINSRGAEQIAATRGLFDLHQARGVGLTPRSRQRIPASRQKFFTRSVTRAA
jgi:hypothetical protein